MYYALGDAQCTAVAPCCHRRGMPRITRFEREWRQFLCVPNILGNLNACVIQQLEQSPEVMHVRKVKTTMDEHGLDRFLRRLLGVKTQVFQVNVWSSLAGTGKVALGPAEPLARIRRRIALTADKPPRRPGGPGNRPGRANLRIVQCL